MTPPTQPASFWEREAAWGLEFIPVQIVIVASGMLLPWVWGFLVSVLLLGSYIVLNAWMESRYGGNIGKYILGLRVETTEGNLLSFNQALFRQTACGVSWLTMNIGHMMCWARSDQKSLHDLLTQTHVVKKDIDIPSLPYIFPENRKKWMVFSFALQVLFTVIVFTVSLLKALAIVEQAMVNQGMY